MKHILLEKIEYRERRSPEAGDGFCYDVLHGVWHSGDRLLLVHDASFAGVASKKRDIETGEDQK